MKKVKRVGKLLLRGPQLGQALLAMRNQEMLSVDDHLRLSADWLVRAQRATPDAGYSAFYSLRDGWFHSYIETTGYIVPTMLDVGVVLNEPAYKESALQAGKWLLSVQDASGAYPDIYEHQPQVFDTGQVLFGLIRLYQETGNQAYYQAAQRASDWLVAVQDQDGSWRTMGYYRGRASTYHSRVAAALISFGLLSGDQAYCQAGEKNLEWVCSCQRENGFFDHAQLKEGGATILHTLVYVFEGLLIAYQLTGEKRWLQALLRGVEPLRKIALTQEIVLSGAYDAAFNPVSRERCVVGLAQWAAVCLGLYAAVKDDGYLRAAQLTLFYLKSKHIQKDGVQKGALPATVPLWGFYHPFSFVNWGVKFFADALLLYRPYQQTLHEEQELWTSACMRYGGRHSGVSPVSEGIEPIDKVLVQALDRVLSSVSAEPFTFVDVGCGKGRFLSYCKQRYPHGTYVGVDPVYTDESLAIRQGSAYSIPCESGSAQVLLVYQVLQHVADIRHALNEMKRVLKPGGVLIVGDRNPLSGRGFLKSYHELKGAWMYPWDSPFRERWYTRWQWKKLLVESGMSVKEISVANNPTDKNLRKLVRMNSLLVITAVKE